MYSHISWLFHQKIQAARAARKVLSHPDVVIWDSETTGLGETARFVQFAAIDRDGKVLLDTLVNPQAPISEKASEIHGITDGMVIGAPTFYELFPAVRSVLHGRRWAIYNVDFDWSVMRHHLSELFVDWGRSTTLMDLRPLLNPRPVIRGGSERAAFYCAMKIYAQWWGDFSDYHGSFTWKKLSDAVEQFDIHVDAFPHSALGDAQRALAVLRSMSAWLDKPYIKEIVS